ncbi:C-terminal binding protein [Streptomyces sp. NPDC020490]|uniref:C-terminal binding protein n=1 Tax=Streptomyces sp. NPDC020490 TaxID=3365078 RepID=UPI003792C9C0
MKVVITDSEYPDFDIERAVLEEAGLTVVRAQARTPEEVARAAEGAGALIVQWAEVTDEVYEAAPTVGLVSRYGVGVDNFDVAGAERRGVWIANVPDYGTQDVAAHAFAGVMAGVRHLKQYDALSARGTWDYLATGTVRRLSSLTIGVLGLGRIGRTLAAGAAPWFGRVVAYDPALPDASWPQAIERVGLDEVFQRSDVLSLHLPLNDETRHIADARRLGLMPRGAILVNTARGGLVDEQALHTALETGQLALAAVDTWTDEPVPADHPLVGHPRVIASPHAAWYSQEAEEEVRRRAALNVATWFRTGRPDHVVVAGTRAARGPAD